MSDKMQAVQIFKKIDFAAMLDIAAILGLAVLLIIALQHVLPWIGNRLHGKKRLTLLATVPIFRLIIILAAFVMIVPLLIEPSLQNMVALFGSVGLAIGFALKDYASSLIAGIIAVGERNYRNGDWIRVGDIYGEVRHVGMRTVEVITPEDDRVLIPHALLWNQPVINSNNGEAHLLCVADFYLHPQHEGAMVRQALEDVAMTSPYLCLDAPVIVVVKETAWGTRYRLKAYPVSASQQFRFISDLTTRGRSVLREADIQFATAPAAVP
ncbi:MAG TPA: mechanosensitive ion channel [Desulfobacteraceae bacterium]|nr:mechanosensitive ion channel [Desulfobacteraceae bacterium]